MGLLATNVVRKLRRSCSAASARRRSSTSNSSSLVRFPTRISSVSRASVRAASRAAISSSMWLKSAPSWLSSLPSSGGAKIGFFRSNPTRNFRQLDNRPGHRTLQRRSQGINDQQADRRDQGRQLYGPVHALLQVSQIFLEIQRAQIGAGQENRGGLLQPALLPNFTGLCRGRDHYFPS